MSLRQTVRVINKIIYNTKETKVKNIFDGILVE